jgi:hypothetical protein
VEVSEQKDYLACQAASVSDSEAVVQGELGS